MTEQSEWQFLVDYLKDDTTDFYNDACQNQLVDTAMYDAVLMDLFNALSDEQKAELHCTGFSELDSMMASPPGFQSSTTGPKTPASEPAGLSSTSLRRTSATTPRSWGIFWRRSAPSSSRTSLPRCGKKVPKT